MVDYVFLDTDERRRFAQVSHEYLIEQVQFSNRCNNWITHKTNSDINIFNELVWTVSELSWVKELVWTVTEATAGDVTVEDALLQLNGHDRFKRREGKYFTKVQRYQHQWFW